MRSPPSYKKGISTMHQLSNCLRAKCLCAFLWGHFFFEIQWKFHGKINCLRKGCGNSAASLRKFFCNPNDPKSECSGVLQVIETLSFLVKALKWVSQIGGALARSQAVVFLDAASQPCGHAKCRSMSLCVLAGHLRHSRGLGPLG